MKSNMIELKITKVLKRIYQTLEELGGGAGYAMRN